jgi:gluconate 2-dehydrogenase gamma chain
MPEFSRRQFVALTGAAAASIWLIADASEILAAAEHAATAERWEALTSADAADLEAAMAHIVPTDETPGAREARVIHFVDRVLATFGKSDKAMYEAGAKDLRARAAKIQPGAKSFAALPEALQIKVLQTLENEKNQFFAELCGATVAGMLAAPERGGNYQKTGWKWIGFDDRYSWGPPFGWYDRDV